LEDAELAPLPKDYKPTTFPKIPITGNPQAVWEQFFSAHKPHPVELHKPFREIFQANDHEGALAFLEAAIRHGQGRTWMYEVLPLEMRLAKRPNEDIERAMLSRADFRTIDQSSMMLSAAYLVRFEQLPRALQLYRQASMLDPTRPEPYALGLRLAEKLKDPDAVQWAALGILTHVWTKNHTTLHRQAENALLDLEEDLVRKGKPKEAEAVAEKLAAAKQRDLDISLKWQGKADLDLTIEEPSDTFCSLQFPQSPAGGVFLHDGMGPDQKETYERIVYPLAIPGTYRIKIQHIWGNVVAKRAVLTVTMRKGSGEETTKKQIITLAKNETVVRIEVPHGRRKQAVSVSALEDGADPLAAPQPRSRLVRVSGESQQARQDYLNSRPGAPRGPRRAGVAYQPVITTVTEGSSLTAHATVSADRRYVRLRLAPTFSTLTDVFTFSFLNGGGGQAAGGANNAGGGN